MQAQPSNKKTRSHGPRVTCAQCTCAPSRLLILIQPLRLSTSVKARGDLFCVLYSQPLGCAADSVLLVAKCTTRVKTAGECACAPVRAGGLCRRARAARERIRIRIRNAYTECRAVSKIRIRNADTQLYGAGPKIQIRDTDTGMRICYGK